MVTEQNLNIAQAGCQLDIDLQSIRAWIAARIDNQMPTDFANMYYINNQIVA